MIDKRKFYINGQWTDPIKKNDLEVINPCNEDPFAVISLGSKEDTDLAVKSAKIAFETWKETGKEEEGFIAHEVDEIFKDAVGGKKDAVNEDGSIDGQTMDYGRITPLLVKAIQEQQTIIEDLKTRIETLEG